MTKILTKVEVRKHYGQVKQNHAVAVWSFFKHTVSKSDTNCVRSQCIAKTSVLLFLHSQNVSNDIDMENLADAVLQLHLQEPDTYQPSSPESDSLTSSSTDLSDNTLSAKYIEE